MDICYKEYDLLDPEWLVDRRYRILETIGTGVFREIYLALDIINSGFVAIKRETFYGNHPLLRDESEIYKLLQKFLGIPVFKKYVEEEGYNSLIIELLGPSVKDLFYRCDRQLNLKTVLMLSFQMIDKLDFIHSRCFIHRDIKPENFLMGLRHLSHRVHVIGYALAKKYKNSETGVHIDYKEGKCLTGNPRYASLNAHMGLQQSRRDDMESLGFVLLYLLRGNLPWHNMKARTMKGKYAKIRKMKTMASIEDLCSEFPEEFLTYFKYCRNLEFTDQPDYQYLRNLFMTLFRKMGFYYDYKYQWGRLKDEY